MHPKLGLCCISLESGFKFRAMTIKRFNELDSKTAWANLGEVCLHNVNVVIGNIKYCSANEIAHYRIPCSLFPVLSYLLKDWKDLPNYHEVNGLLSQVGPLAHRLGVRLSMHPDQYVSLGSQREEVRKKSIYEFSFQADILQAMNVPDGALTPMCLHVTSGAQDPDQTKKFFLESVKQLPEHAQKRLVLENEDRGCWKAETLFKYFGSLFPLVYDNHHDDCNPSSERDWCKVFAHTWPAGVAPVFHWSEGLKDEDRSHSDYFTKLPDCVRLNPHIYWECEVKMKDKAIREARKLFP